MHACVVAASCLQGRRQLCMSDVAGFDLGLQEELQNTMPLLAYDAQDPDLPLVDDGLRPMVDGARVG